MDYATLGEMQEGARGVIASRPPDVLIGGADNPYLRRWWIVPRNEFSNVYLHQMLRSDDDRALHDHPWRNTSYLLHGSYIEHTPFGAVERKAGDIVERWAETAHRLELIDNQPVISLFTTGAKIREWGFHTICGWRHWKECVSQDDFGQPGFIPTRSDEC